MANPLGALFGGHAPFTGLQQHMRVVHKCAHEVNPLIEALIVGDPLQDGIGSWLSWGSISTGCGGGCWK